MFPVSTPSSFLLLLVWWNVACGVCAWQLWMTAVPSTPQTVKSTVTSSGTSSGIGTSRGIPKAETKVLKLWQKFPQADGRGIKIAILDTGCDLKAAGLQVTSDGRPKFMDCLDCTGGGDVDTSHVVTWNDTSTAERIPSNRIIPGLTGRNLTLGDWALHLSEVRLGTVPLERLLPTSVQTRLRNSRQRIFTHCQQQYMATIQLQIEDLQEVIERTKDDIVQKNTLEELVKDKKVLLKELQAQLDSYQNAGPWLDIILIQPTPGDFRVIVDENATGNLTNAIPMAPFAKERHIGTLGFGSFTNYCIQVFDQGKTVSIVTDAGSHGTHVAGIAAAYFPPNDNKDTTRTTTNTTINTQPVDRNGVAPGAQILACKIGDGRLGSAETGTGLVRALIAAKKYGCDLINLSYGEPSWQPDSGRVAETFADAVYKWGMTVFTSAGNDGPALSSLGSPGTLTAPITVGALVSPDMLLDQYATLPATDEEAPLLDASYHFSSRGPTPDGAMPDLCAPGGAISPVPQHALQGKAQFHGTSMASPNACGVAACVLSALRQQHGMSRISPMELKRGLINSAKQVDISDPFAQGSGLISATAAVSYMHKHHGKSGQDLFFDVRITNRNNARGIYLRDALDLQGPLTFNVNVKPRFEHAMERSQKELTSLLSLELDIRLVPSESWITVPERMTLFSAQERGGQSFSVTLRLAGNADLKPGAHFATVDALDANDATRGPLFQVPVTVVIPHSFAVNKEMPLENLSMDGSIVLQDNQLDLTTTLRLLPGAPNRRFLSVPSQAEWATIKIKSLCPDASETSPQRILLHAIPFARGDLPNGLVQLKKLMVLTERVEKMFHLKVRGGSTLEICLQLLWLSNPAPADVVVDIEFHSLSARSPSLMSSFSLNLPPAQGFARFGVAADLRSETLKPKASLTTIRRTVMPNTFRILVDSKDQDTIPPSDAEIQGGVITGHPIYTMILAYQFKIENGEETKITPSFPSIFQQLYDSPLDSNIWVLKDSNSQSILFGGSMHHAKAVALEKGDYNLSLFVRHPSRQVLEQMKDMPLQLSFALGDKQSLDCRIYRQLDKASTPCVTGDGRNAVKSLVLPKGSQLDLYASRPTGSLPSWALPGDIMIGTIALNSDVKEATSIPLSYTIPPKSNVKELGGSNDSNGSATKEKSLNETLFETKLAFLSKNRKNSSQFNELAAQLKLENATNLALLQELLMFSKERTDEYNSTSSKIDAIQEATYALLKDHGGPIDEAALAMYFGVSHVVSLDSAGGDTNATLEKEQMEKEKSAWQVSLLLLCEALSEAAVLERSFIDEFSCVYNRLRKWVVDSSSLSNHKDKLTLHMVESRYLRLCRNATGASLSTLRKAQKELPQFAKEISQEILVVYTTLDDVEHLIAHLQDTLLQRFPPQAK